MTRVVLTVSDVVDGDGVADVTVSREVVQSEAYVGRLGERGERDP